MVGRVNLSFDQRQSLFNLQQIDRLTERTNRRLTTSQRLHSPADGVTDYFISEQLGETVSLLRNRQSAIDQGISALKTPITGIEGVRDFLKSAQGLLFAARGHASRDDAVGDTALEQGTRQFSEFIRSFILVAKDAEHLGLELLTSTEQSLRVRYSEENEQRLDVQGRDLFNSITDVGTGGLFSGNGVRAGVAGKVLSVSFNNNRIILSNFLNPIVDGTNRYSFTGFSSFKDSLEFADAIDASINLALDRLETHERFFANNLSILQSRLSFTRSFTNTLTESRSKITSVDSNEEAVTLSVLQTRNSLAISSLDLIGERHQQLLRLLQ